MKKLLTSAITRMNLKGIVFRERSQPQKFTYCLIPLMSPQKDKMAVTESRVLVPYVRDEELVTTKGH